MATTALLNPQDPLPPVREELQLHRGPADARGRASWSLHDPVRNRFFRIGPGELALLRHWNGSRTVQELLERTRRSTGIPMTLESVMALHRFLGQFFLLADQGFLFQNRLHKAVRGTPGGFFAWLAQHGFFIRLPLIHPEVFLRQSWPRIQPLVQPFSGPLLVILALMGGFLLLRQWSTFRAALDQLVSTEGLLWFAIALTVTKTCHELGHAYTAHRHGVRVATMGIAFMVFWPVLYTDTTEAWKLADKRQRLAISAAGIRAELTLAIIATFLWGWMNDGPIRSALFMLATTSWVITLAINMNPLMKFDGYYLLSDALDLANLQERAFNMARWRLRRWLMGIELPVPETVTDHRQRFLAGFGMAIWVYRLFLFLSIALTVYFLFFKLLGLLMMGLALTWFIGRPLAAEWRVWRRLWPEVSPWRRRLLPLLPILVTGFVLFQPWMTRVTLPAVLQAGEQARIFPPFAARLVKVHLPDDGMVEKGQPLFELHAPELAHRLAQSRRRITLLENRLKRGWDGEEALERLQITKRKLVKELAGRRGLESQRARLLLTAPFAGQVVETADGLIPGRWLHPDLPLARLVTRGPPKVTGYLPEEALARLQPEARGRFIPDSPERPAIPVRLITLDPAGGHELSLPYLAAIHGGSIATGSDERGRLTSPNPLFRARLAPTIPVERPERVVRGVIHLQGRKSSLGHRLWQTVVAVFIRESGF